MIRRSCRVAMLLLLVTAAAAPVGARGRLPDRSFGYDDSQDPPEGFQPHLSAEAGVLCVKQCPNDQLPCDPPSYKVADGRCSTQWR